MIIEHKSGETIVTNDDISHRLADAHYYLGIAMATGNMRRKKYWLKRIEELKTRKEKKQCQKK